jgi:hypothetical protein
LTVTDVNHDGNPDLLIGNSYGDVLALLGQSDGTFRPYRKTDQAIALAVADLTGKGSRDVIYADQGLDRVVVDYGGGNSAILGDRSQGILDPSAVTLADLSDDGIPDLIVANSGSNNVLVYPGLGNGQFGRALNGGHGFFTGTNPVAVAVANLNGQPDLLVANAGSNDVSVLLGKGSGSSWTLVPGPRIKTQAGPDALAVGALAANGPTDLFVANGQSNTVEQFAGVGSGFFNDQNPTIYPVGQAPSALFLGKFSGLGLGLATLNAGSSDGTLITGLGSSSPLTQTFPTGGDRPTTGFAGDFTGSGFTDLVVGNNGDGHLALLLGGAAGLSLSQTLTSAGAPNPTGLSFAGVSDGLLDFYVSTAGREAATLLAFSLGEPGTGEGITNVVVTPGANVSLGGVLAQATSGSVQQVAQFLGLSGSTLDLAATLLTVSVVESEASSGTFATFTSTGLGQVVGQNPGRGSGSSGDDFKQKAESAETEKPLSADELPPWERVSVGMDRSWKKARAAILELEGETPFKAIGSAKALPGVAPGASPSGRTSTRPATKRQSSPPTRSPATDIDASARRAGSSDSAQAGGSSTVDAALEAVVADREAKGRSWQWWRDLTGGERAGTAGVLVAVIVTAATAGTAWGLGTNRLRRRTPKPLANRRS